MLESFRKSAGSPCPRCASMKLTEAKFMISAYSKHRRANRAVVENAPGRCAGDNLGPDGLGFGPHEFKLGTLKELYGRREGCPFCGLAVTSLNDQYKAFIQDTDPRVRTEEDFYNAEVTCFVSMYIFPLDILFARRSIQFTTRAYHCKSLNPLCSQNLQG